jgi:hypothetical protein
MGGQGLKLVGGGDEGQARVLRHLHRRGEVCVGGWGGGEGGGGKAKAGQKVRGREGRRGAGCCLSHRTPPCLPHTPH